MNLKGLISLQPSLVFPISVLATPSILVVCHLLVGLQRPSLSDSVTVGIASSGISKPHVTCTQSQRLHFVFIYVGATGRISACFAGWS